MGSGEIDGCPDWVKKPDGSQTFCGNLCEW